MAREWLVFVYTLPSEPSRKRVYVWRRLKKIGAINFQQSLWILPFSTGAEQALKELEREIAGMEGDSSILIAKAIDGALEDRIVQGFEEARNAEYREIMERCEDFFAEIEKETARENFSFAEIEENEEELEKLRNWFEKVKARDFMGAKLRGEVEKMLQKCEGLLQRFSETVYEHCGHEL